METLGKDQLLQLMAAFKASDSEGDGFLSNEDLIEFVNPLERKVDKLEVQDMMHAIDPDGSGDLDFVEFAMTMGRMIKDDYMEEELEKAYRKLVKKISVNIDKQMMRKIYKLAGDKVTDEEISNVFQAFDVRGGEMTFEDFMRIMIQK